MSLRANFGTCLIAAALLGAAGSASAQSPATSPSIARASAAVSGSDACVHYVEGQAMVVRCAIARPQMLSDHGMSVGEPYDVQGNPVDRHGDVVAVPETRGQATREVFARDRQTLP